MGGGHVYILGFGCRLSLELFYYVKYDTLGKSEFRASIYISIMYVSYIVEIPKETTKDEGNLFFQG